MTTDYQGFKQAILHTLGLDLNSYKEQQMHRRILQWITRHQLNDFDGLIREVRNNPEHKNKFMEYLTINTSHFFRDKMVFEALENTVLPAISANNRPKIWSAGCSIGAEVYSLAIVLREHGLSFRQLLATDIDEVIISKAKAGEYIPSQLNTLAPALLAKYFEQRGGQYIIKEDVRKLVTFMRHDLLKDSYPNDFDLILCRNVFIYFTNETQKKLIEHFMQALKPNGYFVVGSAEQIMNPTSFGLTRVSYCIYKKG